MNVFEIKKDIRKVGYNYGLPVWLIDFGMGMKLSVEELLSKIGGMGLQRKDWIVLRKGMSEKGVRIVVEGLKHVGCNVEVEAKGEDTAPAWFTHADRWLVWWDGLEKFNFTGLRKGQDMLACTVDNLDEMLEKYDGSNDVIDKGLVLTEMVSLDKVWKYRLRVYKEEQRW